MATQIEQIRDYLATLVGTYGVDDLRTLLSAIDGHVDGVEALLTTIDADTSAINVDIAAIEVLLTTLNGLVARNTAFEIVEVSLANDDWANVTFAQPVKSFELQHQALTTDFQFRKSADTEYLTIGAGNTKYFPVSGLTTVGQVKRTGSATIVISAIGYY